MNARDMELTDEVEHLSHFIRGSLNDDDDMHSQLKNFVRLRNGPCSFLHFFCSYVYASG